jgi:hypothetical protein
MWKKKLPLVSWLVAPEHFSDHPGSPWYGAWYISEVLNILTKDPETWKKQFSLSIMMKMMVILITYFLLPHHESKPAG